jgi:U3 small nucleolar RNA-associated protein 12
MVKIYLKYGLRKAFGVITSSPSNVVFDPTGKLAITGALESVAIWNVRRGTLVSSLNVSSGDKRKQAMVTKLCLSPDKRHLAVGFVAQSSIS